ncbi:hypothetical protein Q666_04450 [Marinobacter sp. ES-1]|uniref:hypothetical protein n=1 Tax=Marinobacter sp. ES-1 TaxID=1396858 RepID=UPI0003B8F03D|nr:hypothetical protein [Marinobacter sp. ES-1]ERP97608.1 hypothetical protein Q666_04450 [Marinobacter sp. ES-1]
MSHHFVVCTSNEGYEASLEPRKLYELIDDPQAKAVGMLRVIDESGEDYLFPEQLFVRITLPESLEKQLSEVA